MSALIGIDLGGTNLRVALVKDDQVLAQRDFATAGHSGAEDIIARMAQSVYSLGEQAQSLGLKPLGLGVAAPGIIDRGQQEVTFAPNLPGWRNIPLARRLSELTGLPVVLENDANLYAVGEFLYGAGQGYNDMALFTLGTGVGGGIICDRRLLIGAMGSAGELGHTLVEPGGRLCGCGSRGCLEAYASATGLAGMLNDSLTAGRTSPYLQPGDGTKKLTQAAEKQDELALSLLAFAGVTLGRAMVNVAAMTGLNLMVIGGGVAKAWPFMAEAARQEIKKLLHIVDPDTISITIARLENQAPLIGAAAYALAVINHQSEGPISVWEMRG